MQSLGLSRRIFFISALACSATFSGLIACSDHSEDTSPQSMGSFSENQMETIQGFVAELFPVSGARNQIYVNVTLSLVVAAKSDPFLDSTLRDAVAALDTAIAPNWRTQSQANKLIVMQSLENEGWFSTLNLRARGLFLEDRSLWALIGYDGPSPEFEGYLDRGFGEIDWLPEVSL